MSASNQWVLARRFCRGLFLFCEKRASYEVYINVWRDQRPWQGTYYSTNELSLDFAGDQVSARFSEQFSLVDFFTMSNFENGFLALPSVKKRK